MAAKAGTKVGDEVERNTPQGKTRGGVKKKLTSPTKIKGRKAAASRKEPELPVESPKTGKKAAGKPEKSKKISGGKSDKSVRGSAKTASRAAKPAPASKTKKASGSGSVSKGTTARRTAAKKASSASKETAARSGTKKTPSTARSRAGSKDSARGSASTKKSATTRTSATAKKPAARPGKAAASKTSSKTGLRSGTAGKTARTAARRPGSEKAGSKAPPKGRSAASAKTPSGSKARITAKDEAVIKDFRKMVNLTPSQLERWLSTKDSKKVGFKDEGKGESVGHGSGRKILKILGKRRDRYTEEDVDHIHKVVAFLKRHLAQKPKGDFVASNWRYSLMNWGHDPTRN